MKSIVFSHIGQRATNQDVVLIGQLNPTTYLHLVVDGMGGYEYGEIAAKLVSESIFTFLSNAKEIGIKDIQHAVNKANLAIKQFQTRARVKSGATLGGVIMSSASAIAFWVGDVQVYHFKGNVLVQESHSHTLMNDVLNNGSIKNPEQVNKYKHVVTRSVQGDVKTSQIDSFEVNPIESNDLFIICSDGVHDNIDGLGIQHEIKSSSSLEGAINNIEIRLKEEAKDNFSLIAAQSG